MASVSNRRTKKFVNRGPTNNVDAIAFDVFSVDKAWVEEECSYFFPFALKPFFDEFREVSKNVFPTSDMGFLGSVLPPFGLEFVT